jgi:hypothetical protein
MSYSLTHAAYEITVTSGFIDSDRWLVHGAVAFGPAIPDETLGRLEPEARLDLMIGIARESSRGRHAGARSVVIAIEGDRELSGLFRARGAPELERRPLAPTRRRFKD